MKRTLAWLRSSLSEMANVSRVSGALYFIIMLPLPPASNLSLLLLALAVSALINGRQSLSEEP